MHITAKMKMNPKMAINEIKQPDDAMFNLYGVFFKIGAHNLVFKWNGFEWISSPLTPQNINDELDFWSKQKDQECFCVSSHYQEKLQMKRHKNEKI
jgi:hypothetical protein